MHARRWRQHTATPTTSFDGWGRARIHVSLTQSHGRERRRVNTRNSQGNFGRPHSSHTVTLPFRTLPLERDFAPEDQLLHFIALDVDTWATRIWNEGISGVVDSLKSA
ncbi:hypothetical protein TcCL_NonESM09990 [Trypanosoma cruzi]|nr:hypothetical protein TcCL_NonESM09990 [Trypanosoma cruzi]